MSEFLIGLLIGFAMCWGVMHATEKLFERYPS